MIGFNFEKEVQRRFKLQKEYLDKDKIVNAKSPLVSVCIQTYNHEKYIIQCLDSILQQKTNFDFEIILGEDDSQDNTREICIEFANRYQDKIRLFLRDRQTTQLKDKKGNLLRRLNGIFTRMDARGKYIALCEGDDYWTDPLKLQKQVDFLEANPDYSMCFTRANILQNDIFSLHPLPYNRNVFSSLDLLKSYNFICTASVMFKSSVLKNLKNMSKYPFGDLALHLNSSKYGKIGCLDDVTTVYRIHENGVWSRLNKKEELLKYLKFYSVYYSDATLSEKPIIKEKAFNKVLNYRANLSFFSDFCFKLVILIKYSITRCNAPLFIIKKIKFAYTKLVRKLK